jgi:hypothetical protein
MKSMTRYTARRTTNLVARRQKTHETAEITETRTRRKKQMGFPIGLLINFNVRVVPGPQRIPQFGSSLPSPP